jgi:hypothetical protein
VPAMMTHSMRIRRHLRAARTSVLTSEERRLELLAAERAAAAQDDRPPHEADSARDATPTARADSP